MENTLYKLALEYLELMDIQKESKSDLESAIKRNVDPDRILKYRLFKRGIEAKINQTITIAGLLGFDYMALEQEANKIITSEAV